MPSTLDIQSALIEAAHDSCWVTGLTHDFYRYPARFSPRFARTVIDCFSEPGDVVLDPYMGGGTTIVEASSSGRIGIGSDINSLAEFITRVKTTPLNEEEVRAVQQWTASIVPKLSYHGNRGVVDDLDQRQRNLDLPRARFIRKLIASAIESLTQLPSTRCREFVRCSILRTAQWALDGKKSHTSTTKFRERLLQSTFEMIAAIREYRKTIEQFESACPTQPILLHGCASKLQEQRVFDSEGRRASLIVTSPPYPGVHVLYHRWQVDGRRETAAPYWISACQDGAGASFYTFGDRRESGLHTYFSNSLHTLKAIRQVMKPDGIIVQLIAFSNPGLHLPRYLKNMERAGFKEVIFERDGRNRARRIWRTVPNRKWHASLKGNTASAREVVLVHQAC